MDENNAKACLECGNTFNSITRRKHHCRICGRIVCWFCSMHTMHDPSNPSQHKVRACNSCYAAAHSPSTTGTPTRSVSASLTHSHSSSLSMPHSPGYDGSELSRSHPDHAASLPVMSPVLVDDVSGSVLASPLKDSLHPLPMPVFSSPDAVDNTVAAVTTIMLEEQRRREHLGGPVHITANTTLPPASPSHAAVISDAHPHTIAADSPPSHDPHKLTIFVPSKSPRHHNHGHSKSDPSTPKVFVPDVAPVSASEPVSPSHALEQALKHQPISPMPSHEPPTPTPNHHQQHSHHHSSPFHHSHHHPPQLSPNTQHQHQQHHHPPTHVTSITPSSTSTTTYTSSSTTASTSNGTSTASSTTTISTAIVATPAAVPPSPHPEPDEKVVLDLPMKLCLVILKKTAADMKARYSEYLRTKEARHEAQPLTFQQYMFFSTIRTLPDFLFKKTDLAYVMMREENAVVVERELFIRYAPILPPLASKLDAERVFDSLAVDYGDVRGVGLNVFKAYVENLQREWALDKHWETWRDDYQLGKSETMLSIRNGVTDTTHFPPHMGTVGLTTNHLLYQSVFKKRRCINWLDVVKVERNSDGFLRKNDNAGIKLHFLRDAAHDHKEEKEDTPLLDADHLDDHTHLTVHHGTVAPRIKQRTKSNADKPPIKVLHWDLPGMSSEAHHLKVSFYLQLRILHTSHLISQHLHDTDPLTAAATLQETFDLLRRMRALEHVPGLHFDAAKLNPYGEFDDKGKDDFIRRIREVVRKTERVKDSKKNWLTSILPGLAGEKEGIKGHKGEHGIDDIDPEFKPAYKTLEEMNKQAEEVEPFSVKNFSYNVKLFSRQLQALIFVFGVVSKVRNWENPLVTVSFVAFLLNMCYRNYLVYLPAMVILLNIIILIVFKFDPDFIQNYLDEEKKREAEQEALEDSTTNSAPVIISTITSTASTPNPASAPCASPNPAAAAAAAAAGAACQPIASAVTVVRPKADAHKKKEEPTGLLAKLKEYRDVAVKTKDHLETVQHGLHDINMKTLRVEGLYKWYVPILTHTQYINTPTKPTLSTVTC